MGGGALLEDAEGPAGLEDLPGRGLTMWERLAEQFADGDILYGLDKGRGDAKKAILEHRRTIERQTVVFCFFRQTKQFERILIQNDITNSVFDPMANGLKTDAEIRKTKAVQSDPDRAIVFRNFVASHEKYSLAKYKATGNMDDARAAWLKTSKAGLEFQATKRIGFRIHFILDGLAFDRVLAQVDVPGGFATTKIRTPLDITSGEVRWLFRHRNDAGVTQAVVFWLQGQIKQAPWLWPENKESFTNFLYTKDQMLKDEEDDQFRSAILELKAALMVQRAFRKKKGTYYVRPGDSLIWIARMHGVTVEELKAWNHLADEAVKVGMMLQVRRPMDQAATDVTSSGLVNQRVAFWENIAKNNS
jgi:hypothetical protein